MSKSLVQILVPAISIWTIDFEAIRALKRRLSNVVFACMLADQKRGKRARAGNRGRLLTPVRPALTPDAGPSDKPHPGPARQQPKCTLSEALT